MIKAVVFDAYGTLFDVYSVSDLAEQLYPGQGASIANFWRDKQIEYTRLITMSDASDNGGSRYYQSFWSITQAALEYTLARLGLPASTPNQTALMDQYAKLAAYPENKSVLEQIKKQGLPTAILSNGNHAMLDKAVTSAGFEHLLDQIISIERVRTFKTSPASYALVGQVLEVQPHEVLFVSSNAWDALGATWFGFTTFWVNRLNLPFETIGPRPDFVGNDLTAVLGAIQTLTSET
jgi:2-haloacid dehalogenase